MAKLTLAVLLGTSLLMAAQSSSLQARRAPLAGYIGHWQTSGKFYDTKFSKAHTVTSTLDCGWSPQGNYMVCEQFIHDDQGEHTQLTIYTPNPNDANFTFYTFNKPGEKPYMGSLKIDGDTWTYGPPPGETANFRTTNIVKSGEVTYKVELADDSGKWTTISEGGSHRVPNSDRSKALSGAQ